MTWTFGIETGGTFTDLFLIGPDGQVFADKIPSTPSAPERAAAQAFEHGLALADASPKHVTRLLHRSTIAVNALIERRAGRPSSSIATGRKSGSTPPAITSCSAATSSKW